MLTDASGTVVGTQGYYPFGETRYKTGNLNPNPPTGSPITDRLYTGQQEITGLGLYNYKARFYDPMLGRFISPDSITPGGPEGLNRYSYGLNNPVNYNDPTGHSPECILSGGGGCLWWAGLTGVNAAAGLENYNNDTDANLAMYGITAGPGTADSEKLKLGQAVTLTANADYASGKFLSANAAFRGTHGDFSVNAGTGTGRSSGNCLTQYGTITCGSNVTMQTYVHEVFHIFDAYYQAHASNDICPGGNTCFASDHFPYDWVNDKDYQTRGYKCSSTDCISHPPESKYGDYNAREAAANDFQNWVLGSTNIDLTNFGYKLNRFGDDLQGWINDWMPYWLEHMGY